MAVYQVNRNTGKAPTGLSQGDYVVTNAGVYKIDNVLDSTAGKYSSSLVDNSVNLSNYSNQYGSYSSAPSVSGGSGISEAQKYAYETSPATSSQRSSNTPISAGTQSSTVSNYGQGTLSYDTTSGRIIRTMPNGRQYYVDPGEAKYNSIYAEYVSTHGNPQSNFANVQGNIGNVSAQQDTSNNAQIDALNAQVQDLINQLASQEYTPVDQSQYRNDILSYEEAYELAKNIIEPQYTSTYQQAAQQAAQNLDRAGLYNSLYGQQLAATAQNQISNDMNAAVAQQALSLQQMSRDEALAWYQAAVNENQFGADYGLSSKGQAASAASSLINNLLTQSEINNNFALQSAALELQKQQTVIDAQLAAATISQAEADIAYTKLLSEAQQLENTAMQQQISGYSSTSGSGYSGGSGGGSNPTYDADVAALQQQLKDAGYYTGAIDGIEGPLTQAALNRYNERSNYNTTWLQSYDKARAGSSAQDIAKYLIDKVNNGTITSNEADAILDRLGI